HVCLVTSVKQPRLTVGAFIFEVHLSTRCSGRDAEATAWQSRTKDDQLKSDPEASGLNSKFEMPPYVIPLHNNF
ncbi:MAG TPA: hypothetical protein VGA99_06685, partial [bacterium]